MDSYQPERFALTGATGALGFSFARALFQREPNIRATLLVRQASESFRAEPFQNWLRENRGRLTLLEGDVRELDPAQLDALLYTDGGLWHFAALTSLDAESESVARDIQRVNVEGAARLAEAARQTRGTGPFFHISTAYVAGRRRGLIREDEADLGQQFRNPYEASKLAAELAVQRAFAAGVNGAIFRPSVVVDDSGATGGFKMVDACAYAVALAVRRGEPFVFRLDPAASLNLIHNDWVTAALIDLARLPSGPGRTYHLAAPRATRFSDIGQILEKLVPSLKIGFAPESQRRDLPTASKIFDKAVADLRPYLETDVVFDLTYTLRDLSPAVREAPLDLAPFVESRLRAELARLKK
jgi:nucleoside-diphosphate-sugar epimerase